jgi:hypothetical protein
MAQDDFDRVQTDLAAMKAVCVEPAIPTEEIVPNLILAGVGAVLMVGTFFLPQSWITASVLVAVVLGTVAYIPLKRRVFRSDYPRRRLEIKEAWVSAIGGVATVAYVIWFRFAVSGSRESLQLMFPGLLFVIGVTIVAYCIVGSRRMYYLGTGIAATVGALVLHFAAGPRSFHTILFGTLVAVGLSNAILLWWAARRQRSEQGGN